MILRLGGVPLRFGAEPLMQFARKFLLAQADAHLTLEERKIHIAQKAAWLVMLPWLHRRLRAMGVDAPPPNCPKGVDYNNWAMLYAVTALLELGKDYIADIQYQELPDGSLLLTGLAPATAGPAVDSPAPAPLAAPQAPDAASPADNPSTPSAGTDDRGEPSRSLVHPGADGQRQDALRQAADSGIVDTLPTHEPVRAG